MTVTVGTAPVAQGDILIIPISEIPNDAKRAVSTDGVYVIAHSETGHNHVIDAPRAEVFEAANDEFVAYIHSLGDAEIVHKRSFDTHEAVFLPAGNYEVRRQREYVPDGFRRAAD